MLEQLLSIKLSSHRSLVGGMAPSCPQRELCSTTCLCTYYYLCCRIYAWRSRAFIISAQHPLLQGRYYAPWNSTSWWHEQPKWENKLITAQAAPLNFLRFLVLDSLMKQACTSSDCINQQFLTQKCIFHAEDFRSQGQKFLAAPERLGYYFPICWRQWQCNRVSDRFVLENRKTFWLN